jgi:hypothetical protein
MLSQRGFLWVDPYSFTSEPCRRARARMGPNGDLGGGGYELICRSVCSVYSVAWVDRWSPCIPWPFDQITPLTHSDRRAVKGSTRIARRAGM